MKGVTVKIEEETHSKLKMLSFVKKKPVKEIINTALDFYIRENEQEALNRINKFLSSENQVEDLKLEEVE